MQYVPRKMRWLLLNMLMLTVCESPKPPKARTGKRIAVIGSGPSGLAVADQLIRGVTCYCI